MPLLPPMDARDPDEPHRAATQLELFFDLVSVIAIATLTASFHHAVSAGHGWEMLPNFLFLFVAIWWAWMNHTWYASAFDNDDPTHRVLTIVIMAGFLTFAAGVAHIFETLDFGFGLAGWIIMRVGMMGLWLRAALRCPAYRATAMRYFWGIFVAQLGWTLFYFAVEPGGGAFFRMGALIFLVEFSVPVIAERAKATPWHRHHIIERYGLLNIIVLGEVLLSLSLMLGGLYEGAFSARLVIGAVSGLITVFALWWLYFIEPEHLNSTRFHRAFIWGYGHILIYGSGALLGAGLGAWMDVLTHHSEIPAARAAAYVNLPVAVYLLALWLIRDLFHDIGSRRAILPLGAAALLGAAWLGTGPAVTAAVCLGVLVLRLPRRRPLPARAR